MSQIAPGEEHFYDALETLPYDLGRRLTNSQASPARTSAGLSRHALANSPSGRSPSLDSLALDFAREVGGIDIAQYAEFLQDNFGRRQACYPPEFSMLYEQWMVAMSRSTTEGGLKEKEKGTHKAKSSSEFHDGNPANRFAHQETLTSDLKEEAAKAHIEEIGRRRVVRREVRGRRYEAAELLKLCPVSFPKLDATWELAVAEMFDKERVVPAMSGLIVASNRRTAAALKLKLVPVVSWSLIFCRFPNANNARGPYPNAQIGKINLRVEVIDENETIKKYRFARTLIIASTPTVLRGAENRVNSILNQNKRQHPASELDGLLASFWEEIHAPTFPILRAEFQSGKKHIAICTPAHAPSLICDDLGQIYLMNLKEKDKGHLGVLIHQLCALTPRNRIGLTVMIDREDTHMMLWMKALLGSERANMVTPLIAVDDHMALLGWPRW